MAAGADWVFNARGADDELERSVQLHVTRDMMPSSKNRSEILFGKRNVKQLDANYAIFYDGCIVAVKDSFVAAS